MHIAPILLSTLLWIPAPVVAAVGFFAPGGIPYSVVGKTQIGLFNAVSPEQVERNLARLSGTPFRAFIDLSHIITQPADPASLRMSYTTGNGVIRRKVFKPGPDNKLRVFASNPQLRTKLKPLMVILAKHADNVGAVFLVDEPYLNGISRSEMERAGKVVRDELNALGLERVGLGVIFASGMFNRSFAHLMNDQAGIYAAGIDDYYHNAKGHPGRGFPGWVHAIETNRLVTYDRAGNMYIDGGLPRGFDIYGFDFYLSTILLDGVHERTLSWFAEHYPGHGCAQFAGQPMSRIRTRLSFFHTGAVLQGPNWRRNDRKLLDAIYRCRMGAVTAMLQSAAKNRHAEFLLVSESSNNGVLEFDSQGNPEKDQPKLLDESRVLDEVERAEKFYTAHECFYTAGLLFFTYKNAYDYSIKLAVGGVSGAPTVMASIYRFAGDGVARNERGQGDFVCQHSSRATAHK